jgi:hypothetical protein
MMAAAKKATEKQGVASRSADGSDGTRHVKEFVVLGGQFGDTDGPEHEPNKLATLQEAIQRGLHPRGDVRFDGAELTADGVSRSLHYSVEVVPSVTDSEPEQTATPRQKIDEG